MSFSFRPAKRESSRTLIAIAGASGSGKTYSALRLATGLAGDKPIAFIDTENGRALDYADSFKFDHCPFDAPYTPDRYADAVTAASGYPVIVIDSFSHEWEGIGGCVEWHDAEVDRLAGKDQGKRDRVNILAWKDPKMAHRRLVSRLLQCHAHLIFCLRAESGKIDMKRVDGKMEIVPKSLLGWASEWIPITEKRFIYEMTCSFVMTPDKPGFPIPIKLQEQHRRFFPTTQQISEEAGVQLAAWASGGSPQTPPDPLELDAHTLATAILEAGDLAEAKSVYTAAFAQKAKYQRHWQVIEDAKESRKARG